MKEFKKYEVWEDYWCYKPIDNTNLEILKTLNYYCWNPRENDEIKIRIESFNNTELPRENQIKALEFIIGNESKIINGIWNYYKNLILPVYKSAIDIELEDIANNKSELSKIFGIKAIEIAPLQSYKSIYYLIEFDFKYDCEHGLCLLFKNDTPIDLFSAGDKDYDSIGIYENGLENKDKSPLKIHLSETNGNPLIDGEYFYNQQIEFNLAKGAYRIFYSIDDSRRVRNFIVNKNLKRFTLKHILKNCEIEQTTHNKG
ncbi:DUF6985 domain-containing protein [Tenacibaculum ovolyticum]|uniref:DUF6985 domain-containing protein n=1 Tax=Tenacibaculum ovolyticum TaxID=104270 RepID=UPI003BA9A58E